MDKSIDATLKQENNAGQEPVIKRGRGRPRKQPGEPRKKSKETLEAERILEETIQKQKETGLIKETGSGKETDDGGIDEETVRRRLAKGPSNVLNYHNTGLKPDEQGKITISDLIEKNLKVAKLPNIDLTDAAQVEARIQEYFEIEYSYGNRPTMAGLGMCLNATPRNILWQIVHDNMGNTRGTLGNLPRDVTIVIKRYYAILTNLWEDYMQSGKINPVSGIFLGKNNYGYKDQTEYVLTPNTQGEFDEKAIRQRLALPTLDEATDSDS